MKIKLPQLHNQILIALVLGAVFGSIFNVHKHRLEVTAKSQSRKRKGRKNAVSAGRNIFRLLKVV